MPADEVAPRSWLERLRTFNDAEGSSRTAALIRIGLALAVWARFAESMLLFKDLSQIGLLRGVAFYVLTTAMLLGFRSRLSAFLTGMLLYAFYHYWGQGQGREPWAHHHVYVLAVGTTLTSLTPCGRSYSIDRWLAVRRAEKAGEAPPPERGPVWGLRLIMIQLGTIYVFAALDKTTAAFLSGERMEHFLAGHYLGIDHPSEGWVPVACQLAAVTTVALEFALAFGLPFARTRRYLFIPGLLLHASFYVLLPVQTYTVTMFVLYLAYVDPDAAHRTIDRMQGLTPASRT